MMNSLFLSLLNTLKARAAPFHRLNLINLVLEQVSSLGQFISSQSFLRVFSLLPSDVTKGSAMNQPFLLRT